MLIKRPGFARPFLCADNSVLGVWLVLSVQAPSWRASLAFAQPVVLVPSPSRRDCEVALDDVIAVSKPRRLDIIRTNCDDRRLLIRPPNNFCLWQLSQTYALFCRLPHLPSPRGIPIIARPNRLSDAVPPNCTTSPKSPSQPKRIRPRSPKGRTTPPPAAKRPARSGAVLDTPRAADLSCIEDRGQFLINR